MFDMRYNYEDGGPTIAQLLLRAESRSVMRLHRVRTKKKIKVGLGEWSKSRVLKLLDMTIRSHILRHTCYMILRYGGEMSTLQLVYHMQDFGYTSVDTQYKFVNYINKINDRYDLPLSFHYGDNYIKFDVTKM